MALFVGRQYIREIANGAVEQPYRDSMCSTTHTGRIRKDGGYDKRYNHSDSTRHDAPLLFLSVGLLVFAILGILLNSGMAYERPTVILNAAILLFLIDRIARRLAHGPIFGDNCAGGSWNRRQFLKYALRDAPFGWLYLIGGIAMVGVPLAVSYVRTRMWMVSFNPVYARSFFGRLADAAHTRPDSIGRTIAEWSGSDTVTLQLRMAALMILLAIIIGMRTRRLIRDVKYGEHPMWTP